MALADYYDRAAQSASQIIAGFAPDLFRKRLENANVGLAIDRSAAITNEGRTLADLCIRLLARFYPCLDIRAGTSSVGEHLESLARLINPRIEFKRGAAIGIAIGKKARPFKTTCFAGSDGWDALVSMDEALQVGRTPNPLGPSAAACLAVSRIFNRDFLEAPEQQLTKTVRFSTFSCEKGKTPLSVPNDGWKSDSDSVLVGVGAVGNGVIWVLGHSPLQGTIHLVDHECLELSNLQRYVLATREDESKPKVDVAARFFNNGLKPVPAQVTWADFAEKQGYEWQNVLVALDSAADRRAVQASLPQWIANAWTQPGDLGVSVHERFDNDGACMACLYLPTGATPNEDMVVASALGVPQLVNEVRTLLHSGANVGRTLLEAVAQGLQLSHEEVLRYEARSIRELYVEGICGGGLIPLGTIGLPRQELHVPLAHQSAFAGVLLAGALIRRAVGKTSDTTMVTRIDVTKSLGESLTQPMLKANTRRCICEDQDYIQAYREKFGVADHSN